MIENNLESVWKEKVDKLKKCPFCDSPFSDRAALSNHISVHFREKIPDVQPSKNKEYICKFCGLHFDSSVLLLNHRMSCSKNQDRFKRGEKIAASLRGKKQSAETNLKRSLTLRKTLAFKKAAKENICINVDITDKLSPIIVKDEVI